MSTIHKGLTVTVTLQEDKLADVNALLFQFRNELKTNREQYEKALPGTFFISWLTLPTQVYEEKEQLPARIILMTSYVGDKNQHIEELVAFLEPKLKKVFGESEEFPVSYSGESEMIAFLHDKSVPNTFYSGFKFISTTDVVREKELKAKVWEYARQMNTDPEAAQLPPSKIKQKIESYVANNPTLNWAVSGIPYARKNKIQMLLPLVIFGLIMACSIVCIVLSFLWMHYL